MGKEDEAIATDRPRNFHFTCLECQYTVTVEDFDEEFAVTEALRQHEVFHSALESKCEAEVYEVRQVHSRRRPVKRRDE